MENNKIIPLKEKIRTITILPKNQLAIKTHPYLFVTDVKTSLQNLKEEVNKVILFISVLTGDDRFKLSEGLDKAFKNHIGDLE